MSGFHHKKTQRTDPSDSILALSQGAKKYNLARPQMTRENVVRIVKGR
jgi:hypothetical protein